MRKIHAELGELIAEACNSGAPSPGAGSSLPRAFLAALVANETGAFFSRENGRAGVALAASAKRFEPHILHELWQVLMARVPSFGSITRADVMAYISKLDAANIVAGGFAAGVTSVAQRLDDLASSHGLTQIMGWQLLPYGAPLSMLQQPFTNLQFAVKLLGAFAKTFQLDPAKDFGAMFRCWNDGSPTGKTFDPNYTMNGMRRLELYAGGQNGG